MQKDGTTAEQFAKTGWKNHEHSVNNPCSQCQGELSLEDILAARMISEPLTALQCCPTSDGAGAPILASEAFLKKHRLQGLAIEIARRAMPTDFDSSFEEKRMIKAVSFDVTRKKVEKVYKRSALSLEKVGMVEPQDSSTAATSW